MLRHGGSQPRIKEGASHHARRGKNAEAFLITPHQNFYFAGTLHSISSNQAYIEETSEGLAHT